MHVLDYREVHQQNPKVNEANNEIKPQLQSVELSRVNQHLILQQYLIIFGICVKELMFCVLDYIRRAQ
jgi:hypothetical protein